MFAARSKGAFKKNMKYDMILMNPPYDVGASVISPVDSLASEKTKTVVLAPLSCYKPKKNRLWEHVEKMGIADPKLFQDASITNNLCVCTLSHNLSTSYNTYEEMEMKTFDPRYNLVFTYIGNADFVGKYHLIPKQRADVNQKKSIYLMSRLGSASGYNGNGTGYEWNNFDRTNLDGFDLDGISENNNVGTYLTWSTEKGRNNFWTCYKHGGKNGLIARLIVATRKSKGSYVVAIPQINWGIYKRPFTLGRRKI